MTEELDWLDVLETADYRWEGREPPASEEAIAALAHFAGHELPDDYVTFLRCQNGGALWYRDVWYLQLWRAEDIPSWSAAYGFTPEEITGALVLGSNGGGEALAFDMREERPDRQYPIYAINFITVGWEEVIRVAPDFRSLLLLRYSLLSHDEVK
jgi:hypothetical protein